MSLQPSGCKQRRFESQVTAEKAVAKGAEGVPAECTPGGHWHLEAVAASKPRTSAKRPDGPVPKVRAVVLIRDGYMCVRCGKGIAEQVYSIHHRVLRSQGGTHTPENLVTLCGTGTTGCHGWVHANITEATDAGWIVQGGEDPATVLVQYVSEHGGGYSALLEADGGLVLGDRETAGAA